MKEINELKEKLITRRMKWMRSETTIDYVINDLMDLTIGITECLEAQPVSTSMRITLASLKSAELKGMIKALRWSLESDYADRLAAIARLENGGDL